VHLVGFIILELSYKTPRYLQDKPPQPGRRTGTLLLKHELQTEHHSLFATD